MAIGLSQYWQEEEADEIKTKLDGLKRTEKDRLNNIKRLERAIAEAKHRIENPPEIESLDAINTEIVRRGVQHSFMVGAEVHTTEAIEYREQPDGPETVGTAGEAENEH